jgi:protein TonB
MMTSAAAIQLPVPRLSPGLLSVVLMAHAGVLLAMVAMQPADEPVVTPRALTVSLIEMPEAAKKPKPQPPRPVVQPQPKPPVLAVAQAKVAPTEQAPVVVEPPRPVAEPLPAAPATVAEVSRPAPPPPLVEPRFDANYLDNPKPSYPNLSKRLGEQGTVQLRVFVNVDGSVGKLELKRSSGHPRLDQSAMSTVQNWRFVPARQGSQAVAAWVVVPINFTLGS